jgi:hypothetical protein
MRFNLNTGRPKDIPPLVPDCGWNRGEEIKIVDFLKKYLTPTSGVGVSVVFLSYQIRKTRHD